MYMKINISYENFRRLKGAALALVMVTPFALTGCGKKAECNVDGSHAHMYKNESGVVRFIEKENLTYEGYTRYDDYISIEDQEDLYKYLTKKDLMRIDDNLDYVVNTQEAQHDFTEYRYRYTHLQPIPHFRKIGKVTSTYFTYIPVTRYSWTSDPNHSRLTGETRLCHYVYRAYKVGKNEKGKYVMIESPYVEDLREVMDEYPYMKKEFYTIVTTNGEVADYEDGREEDLTEEEKNRNEEYEEENNEATVEPQAYNQEQGKNLVKTYM